jgi:hypothetical protein
MVAYVSIGPFKSRVDLAGSLADLAPEITSWSTRFALGVEMNRQLSDFERIHKSTLAENPTIGVLVRQQALRLYDPKGGAESFAPATSALAIVGVGASPEAALVGYWANPAGGNFPPPLPGDWKVADDMWLWVSSSGGVSQTRRLPTALMERKSREIQRMWEDWRFLRFKTLRLEQKMMLINSSEEYHRLIENYRDRIASAGAEQRVGELIGRIESYERQIIEAANEIERSLDEIDKYTRAMAWVNVVGLICKVGDVVAGAKSMLNQANVSSALDSATDGKSVNVVLDDYYMGSVTKYDDGKAVILKLTLEKYSAEADLNSTLTGADIPPLVLPKKQ